MRVENCSFCSRPTYPSKGITFVRNDARLFRFCRSKCHKNFKLKRNPRKLGWTKMARHRAGKELVVDPSLALSVRRNIPVRYNRNLVASTLRAIPRINEIKAKRERAFYKIRMRGNKEKQRQADRKLVVENQHLLLPAMRNNAREVAEHEDVEVEKEAMELDRAEDMFSERERLGEMRAKEKLKLVVH